MTDEPRGRELIDRYRENYHISRDAVLTEEMILRHWQIEKELTRALLESRPENRWETFEECYTRLYRELDWLNKLTGSEEEKKPRNSFNLLLQFIGTPPKKIYEIGSGRGELIEFLSSRGYECRASEITRERGEKWSRQSNRISWGVSDGVHLDRFEPSCTYDCVISDQVIEHLHPDDIEDHFKGVFSILKPGGKYIFMTPHAYGGPWDISRIFNCNKPMGMHLKEYTFRELALKLKKARFRQIYSPAASAKKALATLGKAIDSPILRWIYFQQVLVTESMLSLVADQHVRKKMFQRLSRLYLFPGSIRIIAGKSDR